MKRNISDLLDGYLAEDMELGGVPPYSPSRIKEITMNHIMNTEHNDQPKTKARAGRRPMRLLIAAAYSGFVVWHAGLSGSIPLQMAAEGGKEFLGVVYQAPLTQTILHPMNIIMCLVVLVGMPLINYAMHPDKEHTIVVNPALLQDEKEREYKIETPAEKMEHSKILWAIILVMGFVYIVLFFIRVGAAKLDLNAVNAIFLFLGLLAHGDLRKYVDAIGEAAGGAAGVLLQFPFYAGIMGLMVAQNADQVSLAKIIAQFFATISTDITFPMWTFLSGGIINFFVPSGGGQWAVQGPIVMPAATDILAKMGTPAAFIFDEAKKANVLDPNSATYAQAMSYYGRAAMGIAACKLIVRNLVTGTHQLFIQSPAVLNRYHRVIFTMYQKHRRQFDILRDIHSAGSLPGKFLIPLYPVHAQKHS